MKKTKFGVFILIILLTFAVVFPGAGALSESTGSGAYFTESRNLPESKLNGQWSLITSDAGWPVRFQQCTVAMTDGTIILMGGGERGKTIYNDVWKSTDHGASWNLVNPSAGWGRRYAHSAAILPDGTIILVGGDSGTRFLNDVWRSTDGGVSWTLVNASTGWTPRVFMGLTVTSDGSIIAAGGTLAGAYTQFDDVWRSTDQGATWTLVNGEPGWSARYGHSMITLPDDSILIIGGYTFGSGYWNETWRSTDKGVSWNRVSSRAGWPARIHQSCVVMTDGSIILSGGQDNPAHFYHDVWRSTDSGRTWSLVNSNPGWEQRAWHTTEMMPDGSIVLIGGRGMDDVYDNVWRFVPDNPMPSPASDLLNVTKEIQPNSIKKGTNAWISITVRNQGKTPIHDVEIYDSIMEEFPVIEGTTQYSMSAMGPDDTRILTYQVSATKAGSFRLNRTTVMYADPDGNYHYAYSGYENVNVLASILDQEQQQAETGFFQDLVRAINEFFASITR